MNSTAIYDIVRCWLYSQLARACEGETAVISVIHMDATRRFATRLRSTMNRAGLNTIR